ncbi:MAG: ornithine uptake porin CarO [Kurthia sp.]|nr:ornithine uptake porin CarO [Candidatus Kurthia equi]
MKSLRVLAVVSALSAVSGLAMAEDTVVHDGYVFEPNQLVPTGARLEVGTAGYGGALSWTASPKVGVTLGYNGGDISWSDDIKVNGSKYDIDMENNNVYLNAELRPWGDSQSLAAQGLYVAAGVAYLDNKYDLDRRVLQGENFSVNGQNFLAGDGGVRINGKMDYENDIAPYVGLGWAPKFNQNWGVFGEVGAYYTGNPTVQLTGSGDSVTVGDDTFQQALRAEERKIENDDKYAWLPVAKLGVNFYW